MPFAKVEEVVLKKAQQEAAALIAEAGKHLDAQSEKDAARLKAQHAYRVDSARAEIQSALEREMQEKESDARQKLLGQKNEILGQVFDQAAERIVSTGAYRDWLKRQIARVPRMEQAAVRVAARDHGVMADLLRESGRSDLRLDQFPAAIRGGFIVHGKDFDLDFSIDALLGVLRISLAEKATTELFGDVKL